MHFFTFLLLEFIFIYKTKTNNLSYTKQADQICYSVLCVFSYVAAGTEQKKQLVAQEQAKIASAAASLAKKTF